MKRNAGVFLALAFLAVVPVTLTFLFSGDDEDRVREAEPAGLGGASGEPMELSKAATAEGVPVFKGFEKARYQQYDAQIARLCADFNAKRKVWAGSTDVQAQGIPPLRPAQVKAHMIQETGGGDLKSRTAWAHDPLQVNVPGDWNAYKKYLGLKKPRRCNEGTLAGNIKAGLMLLARKGFGVSGQPAANRPDGAFDGWPRALQRYNGRSDKTESGVPYSEAYSKRIRERAENPASEVPIPIPVRKKK